MSDKPLIPEKKWFDIKLEYLVPTTITYKISAVNEHEALKAAEKATISRTQVKHNLQRKIKLQAKVYQGSTSILKFSKTYRHI